MTPSAHDLEKMHIRHRLIAISASVVVGTALMVFKFYIYWITQSSAILSDALESIINVVASAFALGSIILSARPPDKTHPYGHGKIEFFSAGFEGALIVLAAAGIVHAAIPQILHPHDLPNLENGLLLLLLTTLINLALGVGLMRTGRRTQSLVLTADGKHIVTDVYTSLGVFLGLVLVKLTGWYWMDGAIACVMAVNILVIGIRLIREAFAGLMDASDPILLEEITALIEQNRKSVWIDVHRLRAWRAGNRIHVDLHLILPRDLSLEQAHEEATELQVLLNRNMKGVADTLVHAEPCVDPDCPVCGVAPCDIRRHPLTKDSLWRDRPSPAVKGSCGDLDLTHSDGQHPESKPDHLP